jgi:hypothetical protein
MIESRYLVDPADTHVTALRSIRIDSFKLTLSDDWPSEDLLDFFNRFKAKGLYITYPGYFEMVDSPP